MEKNCTILIDCWGPFPLANDVIAYLKKFKPDTVLIANYPMILWGPTETNEIFPLDIDQQFIGKFDRIGSYKIQFDESILDYIQKEKINIKTNILEINEFLEFIKNKNFTSVTILGSSWNSCLHSRPLGINYLGEIIHDHGLKYYIYAYGCTNSTTDSLYQKSTYEMLGHDSKWTRQTHLYGIWQYTPNLVASL